MADMPVRAGMVQDPGQYRRSSYPHIGLGLVDPGITLKTVCITRK
jgi:hypothetical protein